MTGAASHIPASHEPGSVKSFTCPQCGGSIAIRALGLSITAICEHCGSTVDVANENLRVIAAAKQRVRDIPLPLGSRGTLFGNEWEVIGYMERGDSSGSYAWREYLLFNPWQGFRFLVESDGHWTFVEVLRRSISTSFQTIFFNRQSFRLFATTNAQVIYVMGEFYWRVKAGDRSYLADYVAPPATLSLERTRDEINWSYGQYVASAEVQQAFKITDGWPRPHGIAPSQPNKYAASLGRNAKLFAAILALLTFGQCLVAGSSRNQTILNETIPYAASQPSRTQIFGPFTLPGGKENVSLEVRAPVSNNWFEVEADLVNTQTQDQYSLTDTVEYYSGYDSDGYWSEGGQSTDTVISSVPGGTYQLSLTPSAGIGAANYYQVILKRDVTVWSNFWLAFLCIAAFPLYLLIARSSFEKARWEESDTSASPAYGDDRPASYDVRNMKLQEDGPVADNSPVYGSYQENNPPGELKRQREALDKFRKNIGATGDDHDANSWYEDMNK